MARLGAIFIGLCMGLIAGSVGAVLYLYFGMTGAESAIVALAAFTALAVYNAHASRLRDRFDVGGQIADLSRGIADLARQVLDLGRRVAAVENKADKVLAQAAQANAPLAAEIDELGTLVNRIAASVAAHDALLRTGGDGAASPDERPHAAAAPLAPAPSPSVAAPAASALEPAKSLEPVAPAAQDGAAARVSSGRFGGMEAHAVIALLREAVEANRIDLHLQPIVTLPQRKVRYYEALARLRTRDGETIMPVDFLPHAEAGGLLAQIDNAMLFRCVQAVRRLIGKNRDVGIFCNLSTATLVDAELFAQFIEFADANRAIAPAFVFELAQSAIRAMGPIENESLGALVDRGFRFSLDHVGDLRLEPRDLADRGFRFVKVPASVLLNRAASAAGDIHPADLAGLLSRFGIDLIAEKIEREPTVVDLLDYDVKMGQGFLFSPPRPVRPEVLKGLERGDIGMPAPELGAVKPGGAPAKGDVAPGANPARSAPNGSGSGASGTPFTLAQLARGVSARK
jgi:cyclic-di-GMP phosphodiesterase TipF (flagellum assembly factor)